MDGNFIKEFSDIDLYSGNIDDGVISSESQYLLY